MLEVVLIRHPPIIPNNQRVINGQIDIDLEPGYETSVDQLAEELIKLGQFNAFFSSDLKRSEIPARRIVDYLRKRQETPLEYISTPLLRERHWGELQDRGYDEVSHGEQDLLDYLFFLDYIVKGENRAAIQSRLKRFRDEHLQRHIEEGGRVGIKGHSYWINYFRNLSVDGGMLSRPYERLENLALIRLLIDGQNVKELKG